MSPLRLLRKDPPNTTPPPLSLLTMSSKEVEAQPLYPKAVSAPRSANRAIWTRPLLALIGICLWFGLRGSFNDTLHQATSLLQPIQGLTSGSVLLANKTLPADEDVDWAKVPLGKLTAIKCWDDEFVDAPGTHCYRMQAPLNHLNKSDTRRASLAVVKYEAGGGKTPRSKVLGSVFFNPGGPGGSGVDWLRSFSNRAGGPLVSGAQWLDVLLESKYDILAHDPRGVKTTWPRADCWQDETLKLVDDSLHLGVDLYQASSASLPRDVAHNRLLANLCKDRIGDELQYVGTAATVRDLRMLYKAVGDKALNFIGVSYGTALGSYYAAMFPKEVGRFWLDAVVDAEYQQGLWFDNLIDFEAVLSHFWSTCAQAGPELCALSEALTTESDRATKDKGASVISKKFYEAMESIRVQPVVVMDVDFPQLLTYLFLKGEIFSTMYAPSTWPRLAQQLAPGIKDGNWTAFVAANGLGVQVAEAVDPPRRKRRPSSNYTSPMAQTVIMGSDALANEQHWEAKEYRTRLHDLQKISPFGAEIWTGNGAKAATWPIDASEQFDGFFNTTPATPILFGSNDFDPVTPLASARKMAASFKGSALLRVSGGLGHSTISLPSKCASKTVADYFVRGALPLDLDERGEKVCLLDRPPFIPADETKARTAALHAAIAGETVEGEDSVGLLSEEAHVGMGTHHADWISSHGRHDRARL
ncbi:hypothetical protein BCV69DRAFT_312128 [Microstroma glucosiphilum]|uniref:Alpha/beta-hydrolase n=1 Tax=Pseudomicrostroma glucosiphilum TaxID=1684307 RepID=A0A316UEU0_9BASI|nr:hypothetical protein BCV69DRAFT_312128 [Pseudomicrostroma glucosiphilum]PWN21635.1 hypothetical protein BCV69DRAFT_312128 [Pseudomicrostroma glucosiphilum]